MTLIKSLLLGSAAGIVAVASAQAADLPTRKGAPAAEYVKVCTINVAGKPVVGFTLPGSDTCLKLSGYITGQVEGGNLSKGYSTSYAPGSSTQAITGTTGRSDFGYTTRLNFAGDVVSNTAAGPLAGHLEMQFENGNGFDNTGVGAYINEAFVTWAGITAGKAPSFYSFTGGGPGWANFFSPDQKGFNQPDVLAYTASFGGGFSATIAAQSPGSNSGVGSASIPGSNFGFSGGGTQFSDLGTYTYNGIVWPDFVAALKLTQGWGSAQISGVVHDVDVTDSLTGVTQNKAGWGIDAGVSFNLPSFGAGDQILLTGSYTQNAAWYSGLPDAMWGENGAVNGNGQQMAIADTYYNGTGWQTPDIWSVTAEFDHTFTPEITGSLVGSYGGVNWSGGTTASVVSNATTWLVGGVGHYDPVKNLDFELEIFYQSANSDTPASYIAAGTPWHGNGSGAAARFEVTRSW